MPEKVVNHIGIAPDSADHIALLESRLKKLQKSNNKITGKDIITSMCQFRDNFMQDYMANTNSNTNESNSEGVIIVESIDRSYLERKLLPEQPISVEETVKLVDHDTLSETKAEADDQIEAIENKE